MLPLAHLAVAATTAACIPAPVPSDFLYLPSKDTDNVLRYDGVSGGSAGAFVLRKAAGLSQTGGAVVGPFDRNSYVSRGFYGGPGQQRGVLRYDGVTGAFLGEFAEPGHLEKVNQLLFG